MKLLNKLTGKLEEVPDSAADAAVLGSGGALDYPDAAELERGGRLEQFGSTGQQALGALEQAARTATFGALPGFGTPEEIAGREKTLREESPGVSFASQAAGALLPGLATGGLGSAAGLSRTAAGVAEGLAMGTADEVEQARFEQRAVSPGLILLNGLGGELVGRAIPAALRRGAAKAGGALEAIVGESAENLLAGAERRGLARASRNLEDIPQGVERTTILQRGAPEHYTTAAKDVRDALDTGFAKVAEASVPEAKVRDLVAPDAPVQTRWGTETAEGLTRVRADATPGPLTAALDSARRNLLEADGGGDTFIAARNAKRELQALPADPQRDAALDMLRQGTERADLWGKAAELESDLNRVASAVEAARDPLRKAWGQGEAFDTTKIASSLKKDKLGRGLVEEQAQAAANAFEDAAQVRAKWDLPQLTPLTSNAAKLRGAFSLADEVQAAVGAAKPAAKAGPLDGLMREGVETAVDIGLGAMGVPPVAGLAMRLLRNVGVDGRQVIQQTARRLVRPLVNEMGAPIRSAIASTALSRFTGDYSGPQESFAAKQDILAKVAQNPDAAVLALSESFGTLPSEDPETFMQVAARVSQSLQYVTANLPSSVATSMRYPRGIPPSNSSLREFAILWNSALHPETVLDDVANGDATPEQVRILSDVHPDIYAMLKEDVVNEVANNFGEMTAQTKVWLDILFDADGLAGPGFSSLAARYIQESTQQDQMQKPRASAELDLESAAPPAAGLQAIKSGVTNRGA